MSPENVVKDAIDEFLSIPDVLPRTTRRLKIKLDKARDLIEYIELHYVSQLQDDLAERKAEARRAKESR